MLKIDISIHAPLAGSDREMAYGRSVIIISIHAPLAGSDPAFSDSPSRNRYFNPRSPCGERPCAAGAVPLLDQFQSTLPLRGATPPQHRPIVWNLFQSTLPLRGATSSSDGTSAYSAYFNPRSPCGERHHQRDDLSNIIGFQSTLPLRGATASRLSAICRSVFQSTLPLRGATLHVWRHVRLLVISIHAPLAGSDR